jgi:hypothetical protein
VTAKQLRGIRIFILGVHPRNGFQRRNQERRPEHLHTLRSPRHSPEPSRLQLFNGDHDTRGLDNRESIAIDGKLERLNRGSGNHRDHFYSRRNFKSYLTVHRPIYNLRDPSLQYIPSAQLHWMVQSESRAPDNRSQPRFAVQPEMPNIGAE